MSQMVQDRDIIAIEDYWETVRAYICTTLN